MAAKTHTDTFSWNIIYLHLKNILYHFLPTLVFKKKFQKFQSLCPKTIRASNPIHRRVIKLCMRYV